MRILFIGLGGGSIPRVMAKYYPDIPIDIVEIDPDVIDVAKRFFFFEPTPMMKVISMDGRRFLRSARHRYDIIFLDAYDDQSIPFHLTTKEFFEIVKQRLTPTGVVARFAAEKGLTYVGESTGRQQFLYDVASMRNSAVPMGEFWNDRGTGQGVRVDNKVASSIAHTTGKNIIASEAYTSGGEAAGSFFQQVGIALLMSLMALAMVLDVQRLFH